MNAHSQRHIGGVDASPTVARQERSLADASVARVGMVALQIGLALLLVISGLGTGVLITQRGSAILVGQGLMMAGIALVGLFRADEVARVLRVRGAVFALVVGFSALGALEPGYQPAYSSVLIALIWICAVVSSALKVLACVLLAEGGFAIDVTLEGHALHVQHGSVAAQSIGEAAILGMTAGITLAAISILRATLLAAPAGLARSRGGSPVSLTPALSAAVRGESVGALPRGDPVAITATLSSAERKVMTLLAEGLAPKQVAYELGVALSTVRTHIASGKRKTGARTVEQLVGLFVESHRER